MSESSKRDASAIFFDRDGTLNHDSGYLSRPEEVFLLPGVRETIDILKVDFRLFLFTNQSGVARGYFGIEEVNAVNRRLCELLGDEKVFDGMCIATESPSDPDLGYRKPSPRYILEMSQRYNLDLSRCFIVGDRKRDLEAGLKGGIRAVRISADIDDGETTEFCKANGIETIKDFRELPLVLAKMV